ncbi:MAG: peptide ligase PGM1-related protein [Thermoanaerobaculia bacterium]|nr:hypothetical protein [Thermoanaerobaculia bacterium]MCK6681068.1 peptide ligase PGM1-related protein [Thermoanaerobaculia bacterium]
MLDDGLYPELTPELEMTEFERLKPRLVELWNDIAKNQDDQAYTSVVIPSLSLDQNELRKVDGVSYYEERLLFTLIRLRNPKARLVYVTSQPIHPLVVEYYLQLLAGIPASHAQSRLTLLSAYDGSPRPLTEKILERPRLIDRIKAGVPNPSRAFLTVFNSTPLERKLAVLLGIPLYGADPALVHLGTKSGSRRVFREAGTSFPYGHEELFTFRDMVEALADIKRHDPTLRRAMIKLNDSFAGEGNAVVWLPDSSETGPIEVALHKLELPVGDETPESYFAKLGRMGGVVEEFIEGDEAKRSPSAQLRIDPTGRIHLVSTHDQILEGPAGQLYSGCFFPAANGYRTLIQTEAFRVADVLSKKGVIGRFSIDFVVRPKDPEGLAWESYAVEINLRKGGTTHPFMALQFLTGGNLEGMTGIFYTPSGHEKYYRATDNLISPKYRGLLPEDLIEILTTHGLQYSPAAETGVLFHMIGAVSQYGKFGMTAIGNSRAEAQEIYSHTLGVLERETVYRRKTSRT